ncbi:enterobactin synthase subunit EntD [Leclercia adecarboxylata]|uniref:enterobactin synthase subunit EntD n=1 Tax=Leclercia adecarboxylata TaxID=83655 RepID=UPI00202A7B35|nr:enterobactin synthase subunit EntD [Leclercia adecarboxylata]URO00323.1 enterobactin synthase subunit EntD [Leclercia adecarboxylata]
MHTHHATFLLAGQTVHRITFDPATFSDADLLWLPHHHQLADAGRKRKADHLAGRIAAFHALNRRAVPAIGPSGEPLWPAGVSGSLSHSGTQAVAICRDKGMTGIDCEAIVAESEAREIQDGVIDVQEARVLAECGLPFPLAFTLAFSAKESLFKALFPQVQAWMGFECARVTTLSKDTLTLTLTRPLPPFAQNQAFTAHWLRSDTRVVTLICDE